MGRVTATDQARAGRQARGDGGASAAWLSALGLARVLAAVSCVAALGCSSDDGHDGAASESDDSAAALPGDADRGDEAEGPALAPAPVASDSPSGELIGDALLAEPSVGGSCVGRLAAETFTSAVCSCEDTTIAGYLRTDTFAGASAAAPPAASSNGAEVAPGSVGVNGNYATAGYANVFGSFAVAGERDIAFGGYLRAGEDVRVSPALDVAGVVDVGRDAFFERDARVFGRVDIARDLYLDANAALNGIAIVDVGGERRTQAVDIAPPCACAPEQVIDVAALVAAAESDNDNTSLGLDPDALNVVVGIGAEVSLPGGRYFIHQLGGLGSLTLHVTGKTALFVADDVIATGAFRVDLTPDAELDLFVRDNLVITGAARFGDPERPSATRVYVGGTGDVAIAGVSAFVGNLYAPAASILVGGVGQVDGALFGKNVIAAGFLDLGYDASIRRAGEGCPPLAPGDIPRIR